MEMKKTMSRWLLTMVSVIVAVLFAPAGSAYAQVLVAVDDTYGIPFNQSLSVEAFGVLDNDTLDGQPAGDSGATAVLITDVKHGTLALTSDGSFTYTPDTSFPGIDTFTYQAVFSSTTSQATVTLTACTTGPTVYTCWKEMPYLAKVAELGYSNFQEGFEDDAAWGAAREPVTAASVSSRGIIWESNHPATNGITTGSGPARTGQWGIYDPDHGYATGTPAECDITNPPTYCLLKDGFTGTRATGGSTLYGVGGYFTGSAQPNLVMILDGATQVGLGRLPIGGHYFFGVIDTSGFSSFRVEETDGKIGQLRLVFADDFTLATSVQHKSMPSILLLLLDN
jgi:VCBS repeat-containing protein